MNVLELKHVFDDAGLRDVKHEVQSGKFNQELFWVARQLYKYLTQLPVNTTRVHPRPPRVRLETEVVLSQSNFRPLKDFMEDECEPVKRYRDAIESSVIKKKLADVLGIAYNSFGPNPILQKEMDSNGIAETRSGSKRVILYTFPDSQRPQACRLRDDVTDAADADNA